MKNLLITLILTCSFAAISGTPIPKKIIDRYTRSPENSIKIEVNFADEILLNSELLAEISGKTIYHIDLVYTTYKASENFNQEALNRQRKRQLMNALPQINQDNPSWQMIGQSGADSPEIAKQYFHGFIIHFSEPLDFNHLKSYFAPFQKPYSAYTINAEKGEKINHNTGTTLNIPSNAVRHKDGSIVKGNYTLHYREFRDQADIVYSGIPMIYNSNGLAYNFSSNGMYEIRAEQDGEDLVLNKPIVMDFNCTEVSDNVDFYEMNDQNGEWTSLQAIKFNNASSTNEVTSPVLVPASKMDIAISPEEENWRWSCTNSSEGPVFAFFKGSWRSIGKKVLNSPRWKNDAKTINTRTRSVTVTTGDSAEFVQFINSCFAEQLVDFAFNDNEPIANNGFDIEKYRSEQRNIGIAGHTYPALVNGLRTSKFGVYNCDQIYRIGKPSNLSPEYVDANTGEEIINKYVTCVLDLSYNGSFSFHPNYITCNSKGKNVILLFTEDKKTYMLSAEEFNEACAEVNNAPVFKMKDMTSVLKSSNDLKALLKL